MYSCKMKKIQGILTCLPWQQNQSVYSRYTLDFINLIFEIKIFGFNISFENCNHLTDIVIGQICKITLLQSIVSNSKTTSILGLHPVALTDME